MQASASSEAMADPIKPVPQKTQPSPFDSLYVEYIPQLAPIYERNYMAPRVIPIDTSALMTPAKEQEKISAGENAGKAAPFVARLFLSNSHAPLLIELLLSLFLGIFGVGWLLLGKKRTGTFLLTISLIFYLPLLIVSYALAYFSYGLSILCTGPFTVGAVLLNAFMLYRTMQNKKPGRGKAG